MDQLQNMDKEKIVYSFYFKKKTKTLAMWWSEKTDYRLLSLKSSINETGSKSKFNLNLNLVLISFLNDYYCFPRTYWFHISLSVSRKRRKKSIWFLNDYPSSTSLLIIVLCSDKNDIVK